MQQPLALWQSTLQLEQTTRQLEQINRRIEGHGLVLQPPEILALAQRHQAVLQATGRVEFGTGILPKLAFAFCDSPHIHPSVFAATLDALMECFYTYKNETLETVSDDELLDFMKQQFDGACQGSVELLCDRLQETLAHHAHFGTPCEEEPPEPQEEDEDDT